MAQPSQARAHDCPSPLLSRRARAGPSESARRSHSTSISPVPVLVCSGSAENEHIAWSRPRQYIRRRRVHLFTPRLTTRAALSPLEARASIAADSRVARPGSTPPPPSTPRRGPQRHRQAQRCNHPRCQRRPRRHRRPRRQRRHRCTRHHRCPQQRQHPLGVHAVFHAVLRAVLRMPSCAAALLTVKSCVFHAVFDGTRRFPVARRIDGFARAGRPAICSHCVTQRMGFTRVSRACLVCCVRTEIRIV
jgi:hypothetical protein